MSDLNTRREARNIAKCQGKYQATAEKLTRSLLEAVRAFFEGPGREVPDCIPERLSLREPEAMG